MVIITIINLLNLLLLSVYNSPDGLNFFCFQLKLSKIVMKNNMVPWILTHLFLRSIR